eukprot:110512_1
MTANPIQISKDDMISDQHNTLKSIPVYFRSRDFNRNFTPAMKELIVMHDGYLLDAYNTLYPNIIPDPRFVGCKHNCRWIVKGQNLIINYPFNITFGLKSLKSKPLNLQMYSIKVGNTSWTVGRQLIYNKSIKITSFGRILVHVHKDTMKPTKMCVLTKNKLESEKNKLFNNDSDKIHQLVKVALNRMDYINMKVLENSIYWNEIQLRLSDLDGVEFHINNSCPAEFVQNTLYKYCEKYNQAKLWIHQLGFMYLKPITISNQCKFCVVVICYDGNYKNSSREIIGYIAQKK